MRNHKGSKNPNWKGDNVEYPALHTWVRRHKRQPKCCERCGKKTKELDLHNISGNYIREDLDDWIYVCKECHIELNKQNKENKKNNKCLSEHLEKMKIWKENNPDKVKATQKKHNEIYKEERKIKRRIWRQNNPDKVKAIAKKNYNPDYYKEYNENHKEEKKAYDKLRYENKKKLLSII